MWPYPGQKELMPGRAGKELTLFGSQTLLSITSVCGLGVNR